MGIGWEIVVFFVLAIVVLLVVLWPLINGILTILGVILDIAAFLFAGACIIACVGSLVVTGYYLITDDENRAETFFSGVAISIIAGFLAFVSIKFIQAFIL